MANIFSFIKPKASVNLNGFDLSNRSTYSMKVGQAVPVSVLRTLPGDKFRINMYDIRRSFPWNTASFARCNLNFDWYYMPLTSAWTHFEEFLNQRDEPMTSYRNNSSFAPRMSLGFALSFICAAKLVELISDTLGDDDNTNILSSKFSNSLSKYPVFDCYRHEFNKKDVFGFPVADNTARLFDMLGYGDYSAIINTLSEYYNKLNQDGIEFTTVITRCEEFIDVNVLQPYRNKYVNLWPIACYNRIWSDYFRSIYFDTNVNASSFNFDDFPCTSEQSADYFQVRVSENPDGRDEFFNTFQLRYVPWKRDLVTGLLPSPQFGSQSYGITSADFGRWQMVNGSNLPGNTEVHTNSDNYLIAYPVGDIQHTHSIDVIALRRAEVLQKYRETIGRAGFRQQAGMVAVYGSADANNYKPIHVKSYIEPLTVDEVESTANTGHGDNGSLGDLAGKGFGSLSGEMFEFDCSNKGFGILMCIASIVPESSYDASGIDKTAIEVSHDDYFNPFFDDLGFEPVPLGVVDNVQLPYTVSHESSQINFLEPFGRFSNNIIGYAPRFIGYKTSLDKVHGELKRFNGADIDRSSSADGTVYKGTPISGSLSIWDIPRQDIALSSATTSGVLTLANYYVNPSVMDGVFQLQADGSQYTDHFFGFTQFDVKVLRNMSVLGTIQF